LIFEREAILDKKYKYQLVGKTVKDEPNCKEGNRN
jgi:hypothetical protein